MLSRSGRAVGVLVAVLGLVVACAWQGLAAPDGEGSPAPAAAPGLVVDLHCDTLNQIRGVPGFSLDSGSSVGLPRRAQLNLPLLRQGGVNVQVFAAWVPASLSGPSARARVDLLLQTLRAQAARLPGRMALCRTPEECRAAAARGLLAAVASIEGGHALGRTRVEVLASLDHFWRAGVRMISLTWTNDSALASAAGHPGGLTPLGREVVGRMLDLGVLVDVSHASLEAARGAVAIARRRGRPVMASHSCVDAVHHHRRNLPDDLIRGIHDVGGVVGINFNAEFLGPGEAQVDDVVRHVDHIRRLLGETSCVAVGSDFDGGIAAPRGLENASRMSALRAAFRRHGYSEAEVRGIMGENFMRCWERVSHR